MNTYAHPAPHPIPHYTAFTKCIRLRAQAAGVSGGGEDSLLSASLRTGAPAQQLVGMADQEDGPNSMDFPIGVGAYTGHTRGADGEPLSFGPGTYYNVFDGDAQQAGNHSVPCGFVRRP
jgi:hypothetical protein